MDSDNDVCNILILGETGVGKSTFINSFAHYIEHSTLSEAEQSQLVPVIPAKITIADENFIERNFVIGDDQNEDKEFGNSSTQGTKSYLFELSGRKKCKVRLIDTPGIGDSRGLVKDNENCENILSYISRFDKLHAICFLLKPDQSVINVYFKYCILNLLSRLGKSARHNIVFCFTNSRCTFYKPGATITNLKKIFEEDIYKETGVKIPFTEENRFFMDNEGFKYLVGIKNGIKFGDREKTSYSKSWKQSYKTVWEFLNYIIGDKNSDGLIPHCTADTLSVNEARKIIMDLSKPLADISNIIDDNICIINRQKETISQQNLTIQELQENLYVPVIKIKEKTLSHPATVCTAAKCSETYTIKGITKYHYKTKCHPHCYLKNVPNEIIGSKELASCKAMDRSGTCTCGCNFQTHMHIYYETDTYEDKIVDESVQQIISNTEEGIKVKEKMILMLAQKSNECISERNELKKTMAKFAIFLKANSIATYTDAYVEYLNYLINREKNLGRKGDKELLKRYNDMKQQYVLEKDIVEEALRTMKPGEVVTIESKDIPKMVQELYSLKYYGKQLKTLYEIQKVGKKNEHSETTEYVHKATKKVNKRQAKTTQLTAVDRLQELLRNLNTSSNLMGAVSNPANKVDKPKAETNKVGERVDKPKAETKGKVNKRNQSGQSDSNSDNKIKNNSNGLRKNFKKSTQQNNKLRNYLSNNAQSNNLNKFCNNDFDYQQNQSGNQPNQFDNQPNQFGNQPNQFGNQPNPFGNQPNQFGNQPNQFGNQPNQFGNQPNQFGNQTNQFGKQPNQFGSQPNPFGNQPNQFGNQPNQFDNQPNQFGNQPNQFGNQPNQFGNQPNQFGNLPNQFGNQPNQFGNQPNQFGNGQFGINLCNQPNQFGNQPGQFGNNQFGNQPGQFGNQPNQFGNNPFPNQFKNNCNQFGNQPNQFGFTPNNFGNYSDPSTSNYNQFDKPNSFRQNARNFTNKKKNHSRRNPKSMSDFNSSDSGN